MANETESKAVEPMNLDISKMIPRITEEVTAKIRERAVESFGYEVNRAVAAQVQAFITEHIVPDIAAELKARSPELRAAVVAGVFGAMDALSEKVKKAAVDKIAGYDGDKVIREFIAAIYPRY